MRKVFRTLYIPIWTINILLFSVQLDIERAFFNFKDMLLSK